MIGLHTSVEPSLYVTLLHEVRTIVLKSEMCQIQNMATNYS